MDQSVGYIQCSLKNNDLPTWLLVQSRQHFVFPVSMHKMFAWETENNFNLLVLADDCTQNSVGFEVIMTGLQATD